jgi:hypothetical protein
MFVMIIFLIMRQGEHRRLAVAHNEMTAEMTARWQQLILLGALAKRRLCKIAHFSDENGDSRRVGVGDMVYFPAGGRSLWHVTQEIRKVAICRHPMPLPLGYALRAWNKLVGILSGPAEESEALENGAAVRTGADGAIAV